MILSSCSQAEKNAERTNGLKRVKKFSNLELWDMKRIDGCEYIMYSRRNSSGSAIAVSIVHHGACDNIIHKR